MISRGEENIMSPDQFKLFLSQQSTDCHIKIINKKPREICSRLNNERCIFIESQNTREIVETAFHLSILYAAHYWTKERSEPKAHILATQFT